MKGTISSLNSFCQICYCMSFNLSYIHSNSTINQTAFHELYEITEAGMLSLRACVFVLDLHDHLCMRQ